MRTKRTLGAMAAGMLALGLLSTGCIEVGERIPNMGQVDGGGIGQDSGGCTGAGCGGQTGGCLKAADGTCLECTADGDCPQGVCDAALGACVQCVADADCGEGVCHPTTQVCVACYDDGQCDGGVCTAAGSCTECLQDSHCGDGTCTPNGHCAGSVCNAALDCNDGDPCTVETCGADGKCLYELAPNGTACDDGNACTAQDACVDGACAGKATPGCCQSDISCAWPTMPTDTTGDGCADSCLCPSGNMPYPDGTCEACPGAVIECPEGAVPWDSSGDGCMDACQCASADCVSCYDAAGAPADPAFWAGCDDGDPCTDDYCQLGVCASLAVPGCGVCPGVALFCEGGLVPGDTTGDGCEDACVCPETGLPPTEDGCAGPVACADACDCYKAGAQFPTPCELDCMTCDNYWLCDNGQCVANCGPVPEILEECGQTCEPLGCPAGAYGVDETGDGCLDTCVCANGAVPDPIKGCEGGTGCADPTFAPCDADSQPKDGDGDGCPDWCVCWTGVIVQPGQPCPCGTAIACPTGQKPIDTDGDGCDDTCACDGPNCAGCASDDECFTGDQCKLGYCLNGVCVYENQCCPDTQPCPPGMVAIDVNGDGCLDQCVCANGQPPSADGGCGCSVAIGCAGGQIPVDTDGDGCDDTCTAPCATTCDCYGQGLKFEGICAIACAGCGNFWQCVDGACVEECGVIPADTYQCETNADAQLCADTGGAWDPWSCGHYQCGQAPWCDAIIPGCNCGQGRTFVAGEGCVADPDCTTFCEPFACPAGQVGADVDGDGCPDLCLCADGSQPDPMGSCQASDAEVLCWETGGAWDDWSCGHYWCGQVPICLALIPGCDCGPTANFVAGQGCVEDADCYGQCEPLQCGPDMVPWDLDGDGCNDACLCVDGSYPDAGGGCSSNSEDALLCADTGGTWDPWSCGDYWCGYYPDCDALIPGCDCGPSANFVAGKGCVADPACGGSGGCDPAFACPPGQAAVDTDGDGCNDFCTVQCASLCDCYDANLPHAQECYLMCPNCGNFWTCEQGLCVSQCGSIPPEVMQCLDPTLGCGSNAECGAGQWCAKPPGQCDGDGSCIPQPQGCDMVYAPVCGCDGKTYGNQCEAASQGVSVLYSGACQP